MQHHLAKVLLSLVMLVFTIQAAASERWETLRAINWVENPTNQTRVGRYGELGPYQFRPGTWRMHTEKPFRMAIQREVADEVAVKHYEWIRHQLEQSGVEANAFNIALAWNAGITTVLQGRAPDASYAYAERVTNLIETFRQRNRAIAEEPASKTDTPTEVDMKSLHFRVLEDVPKFVIASS